MGPLSLVIGFLIFRPYKWTKQFINEGIKSFNLSFISLKNVDFQKVIGYQI